MRLDKGLLSEYSPFMANYCEVSRDTIINFLKDKGFTPFVQRNEVVFFRKHHINPSVKVKVYTSLSSQAGVTRACGEDAIRVCTVFEKEDKSFGIFRAKRVFRVTSEQAILDRLYERMREAYSVANEWVKNHPERR